MGGLLRILLVGPYPPLQDGVGRYIEQEMLQLEASGDEVEVLSPMPSAAHHYVNLKGGLRLTRIIKIARRYDRVILHYQPSHYHLSAGGVSRLMTNLGMWIAFARTPNLTIVAHEVEYPRSHVWWPPHWRLERLAWKNSKADIAFHSKREVETLEERFRTRLPRTSVRDHSSGLRVYSSEGKDESRRKLGLPIEGKVMLCIGFIQPHKGFDRAVRAFARIRSPNAMLFIVGSVRSGTKADSEYLSMLRDLAGADRRAEIREGALSDEEFDRWILASDVVILPYRELWSSSVAARAKLLDRQVIATRVGAMPEQIRAGDVLVDDDEQLMEAMARFLGAPPDESVASAKRQDREPITTYEEAVAEVGKRSGAKTVRNGQLESLDTAHLRGLLTKGLVTSDEVPRSKRPVVGPLLTAVKKTLLKRWFDGPVSEVRAQTEALLDYVDRLEDEESESREDSV